MTVYASIITYFGDRRTDGSGKNWELHREQVVEQGNDWAKLCRQHRGDLLCVAGDFNQSLDESPRSTEAQSDSLLRSALREGTLTCLTSEDFCASGELETRHSVDHICLSKNHGDHVTVTGVGVWEGRGPMGPMSDHNGVYVALEAKTTGLAQRARS
jgi:endonuclease/exonuclease/phosphatase family metal-dependent hydrolase